MSVYTTSQNQWAGAACINNWDVFFPEPVKGRNASIINAKANNKAKAICQKCPLVHECLENALRNGESYGVWGGHSEKELAAMRRTGMFQNLDKLSRAN